MLTDKELQSLRNLGNEAEVAADEIAELKEAYALLFKARTADRKRFADQLRLMMQHSALDGVLQLDDALRNIADALA